MARVRRHIFTMSSQMRPSSTMFASTTPRTPWHSISIARIVLRLRGAKVKSYARLLYSSGAVCEKRRANLVGTDFHMDSRMIYLIESFYRSIREAYREIALTAGIIDARFERIKAGQSQGRLDSQAQRVSWSCILNGLVRCLQM
jgi:hypothetical protein